MKIHIPHHLICWIGRTAGLIIVALAILLHEMWLPSTQNWVRQTIASLRTSPSLRTHGHEDATSSSHSHRTNKLTSLEISSKALQNLGLTSEFIQPVQLTKYRRSITIPAVLVERPGRTHIQVATPMTGVITHVYAVPGEAVKPDTLLFRIRLTHEDLVKAQTDYLRTLGELDVESREIDRLRDVTKSGAVAGKVLLEREYARDKLSALLSAQREALRLHGLSTKQVSQIADQRKLLRDLQIFATSSNPDDDQNIKLTGRTVPPLSYQIKWVQTPATSPVRPLILSDLRVHKGQAVVAGETLCILADYSELYIEGLAFAQDSSQIAAAAKQDWSVTAIFERTGNDTQIRDGLKIVRLANEVDAISRTLKFYAQLSNHIQDDTTDASGDRFVTWQYRPGQRLQLKVPIEEWPDQIVLPIQAVAQEGAEYYIFRQNGNHFDRVAVHVKHRDPSSAVIANDGTLFPGDVLAFRGAHQMQMTLKQQTSGGVTAHHGHTH